MKKDIVRLAEAEQEALKKLIRKGRAPVYKIGRANILLKADSLELWRAAGRVRSMELASSGRKSSRTGDCTASLA